LPWQVNETRAYGATDNLAPMHIGRLGRGELIAAVGGVLLALGVFAPWYATAAGNPNAQIDGARGTFSAWEVHPILRWVLLVAAVAPLVLVWVVLRDHRLSWPRGELTAVIGVAASGLVLYVGLLSRPGEPPAEIGLRYGYVLAVAGALMIVAGGATRAGGAERPRKPPGVL
jgi:hypothetical protein